MLAKLKTQWAAFKQSPYQYAVKHGNVALVLALVFTFAFAAFPVGSAYAQDCVDGQTTDPTPEPCLEVDADEMTSDIFAGANIILVALGGIFFLVIGLSFGGMLIKFIGNAILGFKL